MTWTETNLDCEHLHENGYKENDLKSVCSQVRVKYPPANPVCGLFPEPLVIFTKNHLPSLCHRYKDDSGFSRRSCYPTELWDRLDFQRCAWKTHLLPLNGSEAAVAQSTELGDFRQTPDCCPRSRLVAVSCSSIAFYPKACALVEFYISPPPKSVYFLKGNKM